MGMEMYPKIESDYARATLVMPYGDPVANTAAVTQRMLEAARRTAEETGKAEKLVKGIFTEIGKGDSNKARMTVYLAVITSYSIHYTKLYDISRKSFVFMEISRKASIDMPQDHLMENDILLQLATVCLKKS